MEKNEQFEEWLENHICTIDTGVAIGTSTFNVRHKSLFIQLPFSMQWGVYLAFFDSVGIKIQITPEWDYTKLGGTGKLSFEYIVFSLTLPGEGLMGFTSRKEAQQEAIKKAFSILKTK